jgi:signal transduction histidine kinase
MASDFAELRSQSASFPPCVILLGEEILMGVPLVESLRLLSEAAPLMLVAGVAPWTGFPAETAEIFRHEINNPLTGILGNAELVLSHRSRLPPADAQRLQTVVDLAVRLRETTRRLSNALDAGRIR